MIPVLKILIEEPKGPECVVRHMMILSKKTTAATAAVAATSPLRFSGSERIGSTLPVGSMTFEQIQTMEKALSHLDSAFLKGVIVVLFVSFGFFLISFISPTKLINATSKKVSIRLDIFIRPSNKFERCH